MPEHPTDEPDEAARAPPTADTTRDAADTTETGGTVEVTADPAQTSDDEDGNAETSGDEDGRAELRQQRSADRWTEADLEREILDPEERIGPDQQYCVHCQAIFDAETEGCPDCGHPYPGQTDPPASTRKNPAFAGVLSAILPGAGQLYNEQFGRGLVAFFGTVFLVGSIAFTGLVVDILVTVLSIGVLSTLGTVLLLIAVAFAWLLPASVAAWDAYAQAKRF